MQLLVGRRWRPGYLGRTVLNRGLSPAALSRAHAGHRPARFGLPTALDGSGFLAVYIAALILEMDQLPYRTNLLRVHDALAWLAQIVMFLLLGLLVSRRTWWTWREGILWRSFSPFRPADSVMPVCCPSATSGASWCTSAGLTTGLSADHLATVPVLAGVAGASHLFDLVFVVVAAHPSRRHRAMGDATPELGVPQPPVAPAALSIESRQRLLATSAPSISMAPSPPGRTAGSSFPDGRRSPHRSWA